MRRRAVREGQLRAAPWLVASTGLQVAACLRLCHWLAGCSALVQLCCCWRVTSGLWLLLQQAVLLHCCQELPYALGCVLLQRQAAYQRPA